MNVYLTLATRYGLNILGLLGVSVALYLGKSIFVPLVFSGLLAAILFPAAQWINRRLKIPWFFSCLSVILLLVVIALVLVLAVVASVPQIINSMPDTEERWQKKYEELARRGAAVSPFPIDNVLPAKAENSNFYKTVRNALTTENITPYVQSFAWLTFETIGLIVLVLFVILFLLLEGELLAKKVRTLFGTSRETSRRVSASLSQIAEAIRTYLVWRTIINILLGMIVGLSYYLAGLEQWYLWAVLTIVLNYVPYIGTIAAGVGPVAEALLGGKADLAFGIVLGYALVVTFEGYWIVPRVMGKTMDLNATTVMISCLYWHLVWGVAGLFLAMPIMAAVKAILLQVEGYQPWGDLMSSVETTPAPPPPEEPIRLVEILSDANDKDGEATVVMDAPDPPKSPMRTP